jgi:hypothetical protein
MAQISAPTSTPWCGETTVGSGRSGLNRKTLGGSVASKPIEVSARGRRLCAESTKVGLDCACDTIQPMRRFCRIRRHDSHGESPSDAVKASNAASPSNLEVRRRRSGAPGCRLGKASRSPETWPRIRRGRVKRLVAGSRGRAWARPKRLTA